MKRLLKVYNLSSKNMCEKMVGWKLLLLEYLNLFTKIEQLKSDWSDRGLWPDPLHSISNQELFVKYLCNPRIPNQ